MEKDINKEIDSELTHRQELFEQNQSFQKMSKALDGYADIDQKIHSNEWLNDEELDLLGLNKTVLKEYKDAREVMKSYENTSDEERVLHHIKEQNKEIEIQNHKVDELYKEKLAVEKLENLLEMLDEQIANLFNAGIDLYKIKDFLDKLNNGGSLSRHFRSIGVNADTDFMQKRQIKQVPKEIKISILKSELTPDQILSEIKSMEDAVIAQANQTMESYNNQTEKQKLAQERVLRNDSGAIAKIRKFLSK